MRIQSVKEFVFLPMPRKVAARQGSVAVGTIRDIVISGAPQEAFPVAERLQAAVRAGARAEWAIRAGEAADKANGAAVLELAKRPAIKPEGYRMVLSAAGIRISASDAAGLFYGVNTLIQMLRQAQDGVLPACTIEDDPDFPSRGVMLDISRDKVPTMETLFGIVDLLAECKINHLELYMEHTFAYQRHQAVWAQASPMTAEEILRLDAYCRTRFVELVPNQNSFGHFERWLRLPAYRDMAEDPDNPCCLNPGDPRSLRLLDEMFSELLPNFTSRKFNVGCDETPLGRGKSRKLCEARGPGRVYLDFLLKIHRLVTRHGRTMHFWGDIILQHPELIPELPRDAVAHAWGYAADHPFDEQSARFATSGIPFYVCPGTSSWNSISGRTNNCLGNLVSAARNGLQHGAIGFLNTDWGDCGHWQYLPVSYLGFAAGGALSWCLKANEQQDWKTALDRHVFRDRAGVMGGLAYDLGDTHLRTGWWEGNNTTLFSLLTNGPDWVDSLPSRTVTAGTLTAARNFAKRVIERLPNARMDRPDAPLVADEFSNAARMLIHACERGIRILNAKRQGLSLEDRTLATDMRAIIGEHRRLWVARNRPGGLQDSPRLLEQRLAEYDAVAGAPCATRRVRTLRVSRFLPSAGKLETLEYPRNMQALKLRTREFAQDFCSLHPELRELAPKDVVVFYALDLDCCEAMKLDLLLGYDGPIKVWVDGKQRFHDPAGANPAQAGKARVALQAGFGRHEVLIALGSNRGRAWGIFFEIERTDRKPRKKDGGGAPLPRMLG